MKNFFIGAGRRIGRFFWSWGFLKFVLWTITFIVFFYVEEDWRGARAWSGTKAEWEAKGETFDMNAFVPPPVPDDQNLAAIPLFDLEPFSKTDSSLLPVALMKAVRTDLPGNDIPPRGNWQRGERPDLTKIRNVIATDYAAAFPGASLPLDTGEQFDELYPFLSDLRAASATRLLCRFKVDYIVSPPAARPLVLLTLQIKVSELVTLHAILALDRNQPDLALEDIKTNYKLLSAVKSDPTLVGGLVAIGINAVDGPVIYDGLARHAWSDAQLAEIERTLSQVNFLAAYQYAMRCEAADSTCNIEFMKKRASRSDLYGLFGMSSQKDVPLAVRVSPYPWPGGWWDENKSLMASFLCRELTTVDPQIRRVFPQVDLGFSQEAEQAKTRWDAFAPWRIWFTISLVESLTQKYAYAQVWIDQARLACALERYRLAHNSYPPSLDALAPAYLDKLPHDIMNGEPYRYRLRPDGTFLLYSVGWNETDDGGEVVFDKDNPNRLDYLQGDWVWPTPK